MFEGESHKIKKFTTFFLLLWEYNKFSKSTPCQPKQVYNGPQVKVIATILLFYPYFLAKTFLRQKHIRVKHYFVKKIFKLKNFDKENCEKKFSHYCPLHSSKKFGRFLRDLFKKRPKNTTETDEQTEWLTHEQRSIYRTNLQSR